MFASLVMDISFGEHNFDSYLLNVFRYNLKSKHLDIYLIKMFTLL